MIVYCLFSLTLDHSINIIQQNYYIFRRYEQLVHAIIRPPRANYTIDQLGPAEFTFLDRRYRRDDIEILSSNICQNNSAANNSEGGATPTCSFLTIQASIWTRVDDDHGTNYYDNYGADGDQKTRTASNKQKNTFVVYLHGNASARVEVIPNLSFLLGKVGVFGVVGLDFTGSGKSDGDYVSLGYYERVDLDCLLLHPSNVCIGSCIVAIKGEGKI